MTAEYDKLNLIQVLYLYSSLTVVSSFSSLHLVGQSLVIVDAEIAELGNSFTYEGISKKENYQSEQSINTL